MLPLESASAEDGAGSQERIGPKWEESAEKVGGLRRMKDECKCLAWITGLQEGGVSAGFSHSCPGAQDCEKLKSVSPRTPKRDTGLPRTENVKCLYK